MLADYYLVRCDKPSSHFYSRMSSTTNLLNRKGYLQIRDLYSPTKTGPYYYNFGINWRAYVAYIAGILINVVGFAGAVGASVPIGATYIYNVNFFGGFIVASSVYCLLCRVFTVPATSDVWAEVDDDITGSEEGGDVEGHYVETMKMDGEGGKGSL